MRVSFVVRIHHPFKLPNCASDILPMNLNAYQLQHSQIIKKNISIHSIYVCLFCFLFFVNLSGQYWILGMHSIKMFAKRNRHLGLLDSTKKVLHSLKVDEIAQFLSKNLIYLTFDTHTHNSDNHAQKQKKIQT